MRTRSLRSRRASKGIVTVEMALLLPIMVALALPVYDIARNIQAQMILINVSREGANLSSRASSRTSLARFPKRGSRNRQDDA